MMAKYAIGINAFGQMVLNNALGFTSLRNSYKAMNDKRNKSTN
jgi:hypothetical protein